MGVWESVPDKTQKLYNSNNCEQGYFDCNSKKQANWNRKKWYCLRRIHLQGDSKLVLPVFRICQWLVGKHLQDKRISWVSLDVWYLQSQALTDTCFLLIVFASYFRNSISYSRCWLLNPESDVQLVPKTSVCNMTHTLTSYEQCIYWIPIDYGFYHQNVG